MSAASDFPCPLMNASSGIVMENSSLSFGQFSKSRGHISNEAQDRLCAFLRLRHPVKTVECVAAETNGRVKPATIRKWFDRVSAPSFSAFCALIDTYGAEFLSEVLADPPLSIREAASVERDRRYERKLAELQSEFGINRN